MKGLTIIKIVLASVFIGAGVFWSIMFPKTTEIFRPDFVASVAIGVGLTASGVLVLFVKRTRVLLFILSLLLLWSLLLNAALFSHVKSATEILKDLVQTNTKMGSNK